MGDEPADEQAADRPANNSASKRQRSLIAFPYTDLQRSGELCQKIADIGGRSLELTQLAVALNQTADGGTFRGRVGAARLFGLIETARDIATLTKLGEDILDANRSAAAKVTAFLRIPLYDKLYDQYKGYQLPNAAAIQRQMMLLGVPSKQVERARQAFFQSIQAAGFINSNGRVAKPVVSQRPDVDGEGQRVPFVKPSEDSPGGDDNGGDGSGGSGGDGKAPSNASELLLALLDPENMTEAETQAVWTLLLYVKKSKKTAADQ